MLTPAALAICRRAVHPLARSEAGGRGGTSSRESCARPVPPPPHGASWRSRDGTRRPPLTPPFDIGRGRSGLTPGTAGAPGMSEFRGGVRGHGEALSLWPPPGSRERGQTWHWDASGPGLPEGREGGHPCLRPAGHGRPGSARDPSRVTTGAGVAPQGRVLGQEVTFPAVTPPGCSCPTGNAEGTPRDAPVTPGMRR